MHNVMQPRARLGISKLDDQISWLVNDSVDRVRSQWSSGDISQLSSFRYLFSSFLRAFHEGYSPILMLRCASPRGPTC